MQALAHFTRVLLLACSAVACSGERELSLADTEGRTLKARCSKEGVCELTQTGGPGQGAALSLQARGRLVSLCPASEGEAIAAAGDCRPLVCTDDDACPPAHGLAHGTCVNGLCIEPSQDLTPDDSVMLCLSGTGLGRGAPAQVERFAVGLNCGTPCRVPRICRQP